MATRRSRGGAWLAALVALAAGCADGSPTAPGLAPGAGGLSLDVVSGDGQAAPAGTELPAPLVVRVVGDGGTPVEGQIVNFRVIEGGGHVYSGVAITDADGLAQERWTLGPTPGAPQSLEVRAVDSDTGERLVFGVFRATATEAAATLTLEPGDSRVEVGDTAAFAATLRDAGGEPLAAQPVSWASSDTTVATVSSDGRVVTLRGGRVTITAASGGLSASAELVVDAPVRSLTLTPASSTLAILGRVQLTATLRDRVGNELTDRDVTWTTSDPVVAAVDSSGEVTGRLPGTATITATSEGQRATARITVSWGGWQFR